MAVHKVTNEDILKMNMIYYKCHNKAETARQVGFSASTVTKYLIPNFVPVTEEEVTAQSKWAPAEGHTLMYDINLFKTENWNNLITLSKEEKIDMEELRKEVQI